MIYNFAVPEVSGCEMSCLLSSLSQVLLDPYFRSLTGFQALVQKEWVRMGYPFQKHLTIITETDSTDMVRALVLV